MKYKLVEVGSVEEEYWFDTNTLEGYLTSTCFDKLVFVDEKGTEHEVVNGYISYSDYFEIWDIDNYVEFASVVSEGNYPPLQEVEYMEDIVDLMYLDYQEYLSKKEGY